MSVPAPVVRLIGEVGGLDLPGRTLAEVQDCEGAKFHSPTPMTLREVVVGEESIWLCGTCHDNLFVLIGLLKAKNGTLPWECRRGFGNLLRAIGMKVWAHHAQEVSSA